MGNTVFLNVPELRELYVQKGTVVFPNVTPGCILELRITFIDKKLINAFEYPFVRDIPVVQSRFTFSVPPGFTYDFKEFGNCGEKNTAPPKKDGQIYHSWTIHELMPVPRIDHLPTSFYSEPRVSLVLRRKSDKPVFNDWKDIARYYRNEYYPMDKDSRQLDKIADSLCRPLKTDRDKAYALHSWQQDNLSINDENEPASVESVLKSGTVNQYQLATIAYQMFKYEKLNPDLLLTRSTIEGGFDPDFPDPQTCSTPFLTFGTGTDREALFLLSKGAGIGYYPSCFCNLRALSIVKDTTMLLPSLSDRAYRTAYSYRIDLRQEQPAETLFITMKGYAAYDTRSRLWLMEQKNRTEYFQQFLTERGMSNALLSCRIDSLSEKSDSVTVLLTFTNPQQIITKGKVRQVYLNNILKRYFDNYDTTRSSPFYIPEPIEITEQINILSSGHITAEHIPCTKITNTIFTSVCSSMNSSGGYTIERNVKFPSAQIAPETMRSMYVEIEKLNRICKYSISIQNH
jgi:hypothetical protein